MGFRKSHSALGAILIVAGLSAAPRPLAAADKALGEYLSSECVTCHQLSGQFDGIRSIAGWPEPLFIEVMREYRQKNEAARLCKRSPAGAEVAALATYFGSLQPYTK